MIKFIYLITFLHLFIHSAISRDNAPTGLLCELLFRPELSVITGKHPEFSWIVNSNRNGDLQTAYQIVVADSEQKLNKLDDLIWDSGKVLSGNSSNVKYAGSILGSNRSYYWKVRSWNSYHKPSKWSAPQRFNTGNFQRERSWPGESAWVMVMQENGDSVWSFENRHPIRYHRVDAIRSVVQRNQSFFDFGRSAFAVPQIHYEWKDATKSMRSDTVWISLGEKAVGDSIDQIPGGGVLFRRYPLVVYPGSHQQYLQLPRFVPRYPHSQVMPDHMPEVIPFRYIEVQSKNSDISIQKVTQHALHYIFNDESSWFSSSDQKLNAIYDLCRYSVKANTFNGDYAASERERMMYEADCYIHQMSHYAVDREFAIARYSLENMIFHATWPTEWISHTILMAYADFWHTGNTKMIEKYFEELSSKLMLDLAVDNYLISTRTGKQSKEFLESIYFTGKELRDIVDWPHVGLGLEETNGETDNYDFVDYNTVVNAFHYKSLRAMAEMASAIGKASEADFYTKRADGVKRSFNQAFFNKEKEIYVDGIGSGHASLHANMFSLAFGLVEEDHKPAVLNYIKSKGMACGVYGANYLLEALFNEHEAVYAMELLTSESDRSWMNMIRVGATMTTEAWDNRYKSNNGWSHAWSASPAHIIPRKVMGIEPLTPGFGKIRIAPQPGALSDAKCKIPTIKGDVYVEFTQSEKEFAIRFEIPANTTAQLIIPHPFREGDVVIKGRRKGEYRFNDEQGISFESGRYSVFVKR